MFVSQTAKEDPPIPTVDVPDYGTGADEMQHHCSKQSFQGYCTAKLIIRGFQSFPAPSRLQV